MRERGGRRFGVELAGGFGSSAPWTRRLLTPPRFQVFAAPSAFISFRLFEPGTEKTNNLPPAATGGRRRQKRKGGPSALRRLPAHPLSLCGNNEKLEHTFGAVYNV